LIHIEKMMKFISSIMSRYLNRYNHGIKYAFKLSEKIPQTYY